MPSNILPWFNLGTERHVKCVPDLAFIAVTVLQHFGTDSFILFCDYEVLRRVTMCVLATVNFCLCFDEVSLVRQEKNQNSCIVDPKAPSL